MPKFKEPPPMTLPLLVALLVMGVGYLVVPVLVLLIPDRRWQRVLIGLCVGLFVLAVLIGVFSHVTFTATTVTIEWVFNGHWGAKAMIWDFSRSTLGDIVINLVFLWPAGIFGYYCWQRWRPVARWLMLFGFGVACGTFIEVMQLVLPIDRTPQLADILCNTVSVLLGGALGWLDLRLTTKNNLTK